MVKLVIVCHGALASGLLQAMELITGNQPDVVAFSLEEGDSIDELEARLEAIVRARDTGQEVLIFADMFGASPFTVSARVAARNPNVEVVTGVNLPMLLETALGRENVSLAQLTATAREAGTGSVKVLSNLLEQDNGNKNAD